MTDLQIALSIAVMAVMTFLTRALPFLLFGRDREPPKVILYLGKFLPPAVIAMLIVYCYRNVVFTSLGGWLPAFLAGAVVLALHLWKRNDMLSIVGGTVFYMFLVQVVF